MKKVLAFLLAVMMLASGGCAWAEETTEEPVGIMFQGRPWGSSAEEIAEWLLSEGIVTNQYTVLRNNAAILQDCWIPQVYMNADGIVPEQNAYPTATNMLVANEFLNPELKIAGYSLENLYVFFACQEDSTLLISVVLEFECPDGNDAAFADLQQKLRSVYGEGDADDATHYLKLGGNNTAVHLFREQVWGTQKPMLMYGDTTATIILGSLGTSEAVESAIDSNDTSGL